MLLRRLGSHSRKNRLYRAFRELGRAIRTITLLRYVSEPQLREQITQVTNRNEAFHGFADWLMFGGKLIGHNDPDHQQKVVTFNELIANCVICSIACDITYAANNIAAEGRTVDLDDLATISPHITHTMRRFGNWALDLTPPEADPGDPARPRTPGAVRGLTVRGERLHLTRARHRALLVPAVGVGANGNVRQGPFAQVTDRARSRWAGALAYVSVPSPQRLRRHVHKPKERRLSQPPPARAQNR
ncbi:Tn3 family transposase [Nonomuraea sp. NPDC050383]|uniref:Tn3 family transposase n=1 Tax=Nonomuraea sp. NPDC050383 TaxID=3364362 RepID=UPI0037BBFCDA